MEGYPYLIILFECTHQVMRAALWIMGEYSETSEEIDMAFAAIKEELGEVPTANYDAKPKEEEKKEARLNAAAPKVLSGRTPACSDVLL